MSNHCQCRSALSLTRPPVAQAQDSQGIPECSSCISFRELLYSSFPSLVTSSDSGAYPNFPASDVSPDTQDPSTETLGCPPRDQDVNFCSDQRLAHSFSALHLLPDWPEVPPLETLPALPPTHFLSLARSPPRGSTSQRPAPVFDTSTVAAADFDVDAKTGFMPPHSPIVRLPGHLELWEQVLTAAIADGEGLTLGEQATTEAELTKSARWRRLVDRMPVLPINPISESEVFLRRAHHVLTFILHFYVHSQPPLAGPGPHPPYRIPQGLSIPLVDLSKELALPPILTYSDNVLYNWTLRDPSLPVSATNIEMTTTFSLTESEKHFYLTSALIELRGVEALDLMRSSLDEAFVGDELSLRRIADYLHRLAVVIDDLSSLLMAVREHCDPAVFYNQIRPWFRGWSPGGREWLFEGVAEEDQHKFARLSGPSAGQSSLIHALDIFLGVDHTRRGPDASPHGDPTFLMKMEQYMPRHHRAFLQHLRAANQTTVRNLIVASSPSAEYGRAYDEAVLALKRLRDGHIRIATLYIISQARKGAEQSGILNAMKSDMKGEEEVVRGTGGTSLVPFLKEARDNTLRTAIGHNH